MTTLAVIASGVFVGFAVFMVLSLAWLGALAHRDRVAATRRHDAGWDFTRLGDDR